jgi:tRNA pseudouridine55 synthase
VDGILNISKPQGMTSFGAVAAVRRLTGERWVGHAGTLDPEATGVLPVCLGQGTKITAFLMDTTKVYRAQIELGRATDTYDSSGRTTQRGDPSGISRKQVTSALDSFCGRIQQTPPMFSAVKYRGKRLYKLARAGIQVERPSRPARIDRLELIDWQPPLFTIEVTCGKGTYIRCLAHDLGQVLGCGATLTSLVRRRSGLFDIRDAVSLSQFEDACRHGYWHRYIYPIDIVFLDWATVIVSEAQGQLIRNGQPLALESPTSGQETDGQSYCRAYTLDGFFLGVLRFNPKNRRWHPRKVFRQVK